LSPFSLPLWIYLLAYHQAMTMVHDCDL
jgi:hypothetical protein